MSKSGPTIRQPNEGKHIRIFGDVEFFVKVGSEDSGGAFALLDNTNPAGTYLPPHVHHNEDETFYVLEGEFEFHIGDQNLRAGPGTTVFAPRSIPHAFKVTSASPARALVLVTPGGFERCMEELGELPLEPPDMAAVFQVCAKYGIEFLPPQAS